MNTITFNRNFFIKTNSTYPELKYPLFQKIREMYDISDDMLEYAAVTFSMIESDSGLFRIANTAAKLVVNNKIDENLDEEKYTLVYRFKKKDTKFSGRFYGEFKLDFIHPTKIGPKITLPVNGMIEILISDSITKTTVI